VTPETEAAVALLPPFDFDPTGPCLEECSSCCLPAALSPSIEGEVLAARSHLVYDPVFTAWATGDSG
jgi:hypothetical protein